VVSIGKAPTYPTIASRISGARLVKVFGPRTFEVDEAGSKGKSVESMEGNES
jgi:hypothetical protein